MSGGKYILRGHEVVPATLSEWAKWYDTADRRVAWTEIGDMNVSTVFLGLDYAPIGPPQIFEAMVFGGPMDQEQERYTTWDEAEAGHKAMVERVKAAKP